MSSDTHGSRSRGLSCGVKTRVPRSCCWGFKRFDNKYEWLILNGTSAQLGYTVPFTLVHAGKYRPEDKLKIQQKSHAVAGKPRDAAVNSDRYRVRWHFAGAISVSRMQSVSGCTVYA